MADVDEQPSAPRLVLSIPEVYTDGGQIEVSPVTVTLRLATGHRPSGVVRMSPLYAKLFAMLLKKYIKQAEEKWGEPIPVPDLLLKDKDLSLDDW